MTKQDTTLVLTRLMIVRQGVGPYSYNKANPEAPFSATIELQGATGKVELNLGDEMSRKIVALVAEEVAAAGRATAEAMIADAMLVAPSTQKALSA